MTVQERGKLFITGSTEVYEGMIIGNLIEGSRSTAWGLTCPNCGAAIESLGAKKCAYCGTPVREINVRVWAFHKVERA